MARSIARAVRGASGDGHDFAALASNDKGPVPALDAPGLDIGASGLGDPQAVEGQQRDQRMLRGRAKPGGDQQRAEFVAIQPGGVRLVIQTGPPDAGGGRVIEEYFLDGVAVEARDDTQPAGDCGSGAATGFQIPGEPFDVCAASLEQAQVMLLAPGRLGQPRPQQTTRTPR